MHAGTRTFEVADATQGAAISVRVFYPTPEPERAHTFGPYTLDVANDAPFTSPTFPPSQDPPGFDRAAFQPILHAEITTFLRDVL